VDVEEPVITCKISKAIIMITFEQATKKQYLI